MKRLILTSLVTLLITSFVQAQFSISGEFRPRTEYNHGLKSLVSPNADATIFTAQRTRINFNYSNEFITSKVTFQDVRIWGSTAQLASSDAFSALHEAWAQVKFSESWSLKAGRQELVYDDHRIFGNVGWAHQARSHDVAVLKFDKKDVLKADFGFAYNQNATIVNPYATKNYKAMQYLWLHKDFGKKLGISLLFLNNGVQKTTVIDTVTNAYSIIYSQTAGSRITYKALDNLTVNVAAYYQMGKDAADKDLAAYYAAASASLGLLEKNKLKITAGFELLSGSDQQNPTAENNSFTPFYGTNHKFNGHMDYFYVGNHTGTVGLQDIYIKLGYKAGKFSPGLDFHIFSAAAQIYDATNSKAYNAALGNEIDFYVGYKLNKQVAFKYGYSHMLATESMEFLKGGSKDELNNWGWVMLSVTPKFFESK